MTTPQSTGPKPAIRWTLYLAIACVAVTLVLSWWPRDPRPMDVAGPPSVSVRPAVAQESKKNPEIAAKTPPINRQPRRVEPVGEGEPGKTPAPVNATKRAAPKQKTATIKKPSNPQLQRLYGQLHELLKEGRRMDALRSNASPSGKENCRQAMAAAQAKAVRYSKTMIEIEGQGGPYADALSMASFCVSCETNAYEACDDVEDILRMEGAF